MTAVEKLELSLLGIISFDSEELRAKYKEKIATAKEMEKQQIIEAHAVGRIKECSGINTDGEQYYIETYNK